MSVKVDDDLREDLRSATGYAHDRLDQAYADVDLQARRGLVTFLQAHHLAWSPLTALWLSFNAGREDGAVTDYASLIEADLADLGETPLSVDLFAPSVPSCPIGVSYVLSGSRLGMAHIRKQPNWGRNAGLAQRFIEEREGASAFRSLTALLAKGPADPRAAIQAANETFAIFDQALKVAQRALA